MTPVTGPQAACEFHDRRPAHQAIDLFERDGGVGEVRRQFGDDRGGLLRVELPRDAVQRGIGRQLVRDGAVPEHRHRSNQTGEFRRCIERAGQVVGQESEGDHEQP